ncbi:glycosyltransferase family 4 protein [Pedobacter sp. ASV28]|uniref:glycosyltransferase family 4 protein n=1 Tax=Pedobacter sp. ASV28 TaxID=2795123 RepID=UPI0018ED4976|nr:glycosyltransferase family 4 protein [Pedobacter sp. ASV28]
METEEIKQSTPKKVLFITPYFGLSGSEMQLFYILKNLDRQKYSPVLFTRDHGILLNELNEGIYTVVGYKKNRNYLLRLFRLLLYAVNINPVEYQLRRLQKRIKADFWYINTIANRDAFAIAQKLNVKVVSHIHELPFVYGLSTYNTLQRVVENTALCIGCSQIVCEKLQDMGHKNVKLLYGFIDQGRIKINEPRAQIRSKFGIKEDDFVWIVSGATNTIKGIDYLIPLLKNLNDHHKIIWIGPIAKNGTFYYAESSIKENFSGNVFFVDKQSEKYYDYFNAGDALLSLSREDSFPLVMQEAAHLGMPIAGFNSGGIKEYVIDKVGIVIDQLNFQALAMAMEYIAHNRNLYDPEQIKQYAQRFNAVDQTRSLEAILDKL